MIEDSTYKNFYISDLPSHEQLKNVITSYVNDRRLYSGLSAVERDKRGLEEQERKLLLESAIKTIQDEKTASKAQAASVSTNPILPNAPTTLFKMLPPVVL